MANRISQTARMLLAAALALGLAACGQPVARDGDAAALVSEGWTAYRLSEFQNAQLAFESARQNADRGSDDWAMATYGLATTWNLRRPGEDPALAAELYKEILAAAPASPMIPWTELALARQQHLVPVGQEPDYPAVNAALQHILDRFPGHLAAKEAFLICKASSSRSSIRKPRARPRKSSSSSFRTEGRSSSARRGRC